MLHRTVSLVLLALIAAPLAAVAAGPAPEGVVNINTATVEQLQMLPRIGPSVADRIVEFRDANGAFKSVDELTAVKGIGDKTLDRMRPWLTTKGETTLSEKVRLPKSGGSAGEASAS